MIIKRLDFSVHHQISIETKRLKTTSNDIGITRYSFLTQSERTANFVQQIGMILGKFRPFVIRHKLSRIFDHQIQTGFFQLIAIVLVGDGQIIQGGF